MEMKNGSHVAFADFSSSSYAEHKNASVTRSAPRDGSITYGIYFSFFSSSK